MPNMKRILPSAVFFWMIISLTMGGRVFAQDQELDGKPYRDPTRFEQQIQAFETTDQQAFPPQNAIVCTGSSSMRGWHDTIADDLAPLTVIPRGFGGSNMNDALHYADRIALAYKPRAIVVYEGDNDIAQGIALAWPSHIHHQQAHTWFTANTSSGWATCPFIQCGFVRLSSNVRIIPEAVSPQQAIALLKKIVDRPHHTFWPDSISIASAETIPTDLLVGHRQVTEAYLLGLTIHHQGRLATLDRSIVHLLPVDSPHKDAVEIIEAA